jgi:hypothetical protein
MRTLSVTEYGFVRERAIESWEDTCDEINMWDYV